MMGKQICLQAPRLDLKPHFLFAFHVYSLQTVFSPCSRPVYFCSVNQYHSFFNAIPLPATFPSFPPPLLVCCRTAFLRCLEAIFPDHCFCHWDSYEECGQTRINSTPEGPLMHLPSKTRSHRAHVRLCWNIGERIVKRWKITLVAV